MSSEDFSLAIKLAKRTVILGATLAAIASAAAMFLGHHIIALSIAAGSIVAMAVFLIVSFVVIRTASNKRGAKTISVLFVIKTAAIGVLLWWLISYRIVEPLSFLGGFSTVVVALIVMAFYAKR